MAAPPRSAPPPGGARPPGGAPPPAATIDANVRLAALDLEPDAEPDDELTPSLGARGTLASVRVRIERLSRVSDMLVNYSMFSLLDMNHQSNRKG